MKVNFHPITTTNITTATMPTRSLAESYYAYSQHWEEDLEQLLSESTLVLSRDEKGNIIATRQGPEAEGGLKEFEQAYQSVLERLPQECIANDLNEYRSYMATIQSEPNLHYYVNHDGFVFTNLPDGREPTYTDQPIYFVLENGSVQMRMGGTRISGVLGSGGYAIEETADDIFSPSGWYDGFYSNIDILNQYSSTDTALYLADPRVRRAHPAKNRVRPGADFGLYALFRCGRFGPAGWSYLSDRRCR